MISVQEAKQAIKDQIGFSKIIDLPVSKALNHVLANTIYSPLDLPPFPQSSMDGYAFAFSDIAKANGLDIVDQIAAGDHNPLKLRPGEAVRIFTGAALPPGADTVVMQEKTKLDQNKVFFDDPKLTAGMHMRTKGSEIKAGDLALAKGTILGPAALGFLSSMGLTQVEVYALPTITILITGNELANPGTSLNYGQVYDSNSYTLTAVFQQLGINEINIVPVIDEVDVLVHHLQIALNESDIVVLTGGVSVGDFDFVIEAANRCGIHQVFHKIKQKPGKPFYFGIKDNQYIFGLPGNPASSLTCFYEYIEPAIQRMIGKSSKIKSILAPITSSYSKPAGLTHFLKANFDGSQVTPLDAQESFRLKSFATSNALIVLEENTTQVIQGEMVEVHILPE